MINTMDNKPMNYFPINDYESRLVLCTTPDSITAHAIAKQLIVNKLAACVTILPNIISFYYWQGEFKQVNEVQLFIKSNIKKQNNLFAQIKAYHPYKNPELLVLPIIGGDPCYLSWLNNSLT